MSALTKLFVVLLVVCSLLLCGAVAVFVNRQDDFRKANETLSKSKADSDAERNVYKADALAVKSRATRVERANEDLLKDNTGLREQLAAEKTGRGKDVADLRKQVAAADQRTKDESDKALAALQRATLVEARQDNLLKTIGDLQLSISKWVAENADVVRQNEILKRDQTSFQEMITQLRMQNQSYLEVIEKNRIPLDGGPGKQPLDLALNGVITGVRQDAGQYFASISLGVNDRVEKGMQFFVLSPDKNFLAKFIVDKVDTQESIGHLEGPRPQDVKADCEVRTKI